MSKKSVQLLEDIKFVPTKDILLSKIKFDEKNPNVLSNVKNEALLSTVNKYGFAVDPWLNDLGDGTYLVIDGEHRIKLLLDKKVESVKAKIFKVKYVEVQMLRQVANKLRGEHDKSKDADEFKSIFDDKRLDEFAKMLGEPIEDFQSILEKKFDMTFEKPEGEIPEPPEEPKSKLGQIYKLGDHRVMCGNSETDIPKLLQNNKINLIFTDPPYGVKYEQGKFTGSKVKKKFEKITNDEKQGQILQQWIKLIFSNIIKFCENTTLYVCAPPMMGSLMILQGLIESGFHMQSQIIWKKNQFIFGRADYHWRHEIIWYGYSSNPHYWCGDRTQDTIWEIKKDAASTYEHPTQKPVKLSQRSVVNSSKINDLVLDPFLGSGSTLIACEKTNRVCYGMELDPRYIDVIIQRWQNFTGKKAELLK